MTYSTTTGVMRKMTVDVMSLTLHKIQGATEKTFNMLVNQGGAAYGATASLTVKGGHVVKMVFKSISMHIGHMWGLAIQADKAASQVMEHPVVASEAWFIVIFLSVLVILSFAVMMAFRGLVKVRRH